MKRFILNCYFVFYNLSYRKKGEEKTDMYWNKALCMLTIPITTLVLFSIALAFDAFKIRFNISVITMLALSVLIYMLVANLIFNVYKVDKQENGTELNILITKNTILQAILLYVIAFGVMLIRTQLRYGNLVK